MEFRFKKKTKLLAERDEVKRQIHKENLKQNGDINIFQYECGFRHDLIREFGRIQDIDGKSQRLFGETVGTKHTKTSIIAGYCKLPNSNKYQYIAPKTFKENCNSI